VEGRADAIIDLRSIALMLMTSYVFISVGHVLGFEKWKSTILLTFKILFFLIILFSVFELLSGIHFVGAFTDKVVERGLVDAYVNTPVFLWDNPNNLAVYLILIGFVIILLEPSGKSKNVLIWLILLMCFFISFVVLSRIGSLLTILLTILVALYQIMRLFDTLKKRQVLYSLIFVLIALSFVLMTKEKFYGIPDKKVLVYNDPVPLFDNVEVKEPVPVSTDSVSHKVEPINIPFRNSVSERKGLIKNGIDFSFESKFMGIGPGQFRFRHDSGKINNHTYGNNGPHFYFLEILSQYGIIILIFYLVLLSALLIRGLRMWKSNPELALNIVLCLICFVGTSVMPSGFLILDINWIFIAILVMVCSNFSVLKSKSVDV